MKVSESSRKQGQGRISPLGVIALFVSFSEAVLTAALTQSSGVVQLILTVFVTTFPVGVALGFFLILAFRFRNFYAPWEYPKGMTPESFFPRASAKIGVEVDKNRKVLMSQLGTAIQDPDLILRAVNSIESSYLTIDPSPIAGEDAKAWQVPYEQFNNVQELVNSVWSALPKHRVRPYSYGIDWVLRDTATGKTFQDIGTRSDFVRQNRLRKDTRNLRDIGITPGMRLQISTPK